MIMSLCYILCYVINEKAKWAGLTRYIMIKILFFWQSNTYMHMQIKSIILKEVSSNVRGNIYDLSICLDVDSWYLPLVMVIRLVTPVLLTVQNWKRNSILASNKFQVLYSRYFGNRLHTPSRVTRSWKSRFILESIFTFYFSPREACNTLLSN